MKVDLHTLKIELTTDPQALGYATMTDQQVSDALNLVRAGQAYQINAAPISAATFFSNLDPTEFQALTQLKLLQLQVVLLAQPINLSDTSVQGILLGIFSAAPTSKVNISALVKRQGSRAEVVLGIGTVVTASDVLNARNGAW